MNFSEDHVLTLAPDDASRKAGKDLANPSKWVSKGKNDQALWGECQGSGSKPYQTQVDLLSIAFKCSCPSRKFPCKHGIGLLLLHARQGGSFTDSHAPGWVTDWIEKRTEKAVKKESTASRPVDEAAQAKRQQAREEMMEDGINQLLTWMKDLVRNGLIGLPEKGPGFFEVIARRMVDAKAPGLALMLRQLGSVNLYEEGWQSPFLEQLARIYLAMTGFQNRQNLNQALLEDVKTAVGLTTSQEELKLRTGLTDQWLVIGKQITEDEQITTERNWLYGLQSRQYALVLQFSVRGQGLQFSVSPGSVIEAELVFFPSAQPLRALIKSQQLIKSPLTVNPHSAINAEQRNNAVDNPLPVSGGAKSPEPYLLVEGFQSWKEQTGLQCEANTRQPFQVEIPAFIHALQPVQRQGKWFLQDKENDLLPLPANYAALWKLLAISGGAAIDLAVLNRNNEAEPIGAFVNQEFIAL